MSVHGAFCPGRGVGVFPRDSDFWLIRNWQNTRCDRRITYSAFKRKRIKHSFEKSLLPRVVCSSGGSPMLWIGRKNDDSTQQHPVSQNLQIWVGVDTQLWIIFHSYFLFLEWISHSQLIFLRQWPPSHRSYSLTTKIRESVELITHIFLQNFHSCYLIWTRIFHSDTQAKRWFWDTDNIGAHKGSFSQRTEKRDKDRQSAEDSKVTSKITFWMMVMTIF